MADFEMPSLGADMESGVLIEWMVQPGQEVHRGQVVAVVETDKGAIDVEIFQDGVIEALLVEPDTEVPVGTPMARVRVDGEPARPLADGPPADGPPTDGPPAAVDPPPVASATTPVAAAPSAAPPGDRVRASPRARKLAEQLGVELRGLSGTGAQGSISAQDVQDAVAAVAASASGSAEAPAVVRPTGMRAAIGAAMSRSKREIPHFYLQHTIDLEPALRWLEARNAEVSITERVLPVALLVRAVARALEAYPQLCGWWRDGGFVPAPGIHVGLAVALRDGGLVDPALHHADWGSLSELFEKIRDVTRRARSSQLRSSELSDAAITVTSLGDQGVETVFGVIHPPQVAIVGVGVVAPRPWVVEGRVEARRVVTVTLAADHRASDGHGGARFLWSIDDHLQEPQRL